MQLGNPYYNHPQPATRQAADDVLSYIAHHPLWSDLFEQGKMLGVLLVKNSDSYARVHYINNSAYLVAYSGVINGLTDDEQYFVPPVYDLQRPEDFYLTKDAIITDLNQQITALEQQNAKTNTLKQLKEQRRKLSLELQNEIFEHFNFSNAFGQYKNIKTLFAEAKRGLPPGGAGECAAPRLLQYAYEHGLEPLALAEFWYGKSPSKIQRIHGNFYPSCIEKCSPILSFMIPQPKPEALRSRESDIEIIYEDAYLMVINKPKGLLSVPSKDPTEANVEELLHKHHPEVKGPMLAHRLDQATSGVMLAAKDAATHKALQQQFEEKTIHKRYIATVKGNVSSDCGIISLPLTVNPDDRPRQVVDWQYGKAAVTYYEVQERLDGTTRLALFPQTGRTHQLRVHCASSFGLNAAMLGDALYDLMGPSGRENERCLQLHAESITFLHPATQEQMSFEV